ncbi:nucleotide-binding protein [Vibrio sp. Sgm 22]|uniref:TIR domain-containing protein n=1 Tax=unclassified Vibrio TaxID=2614977 RepID=UPI002249804E|nr:MULTISPECIES: TIR domain-containing protein [unclassified Vibrio]MCX2761057.1 nucleotide-binding protein [Vibrio sp. 14G-20]MCX2777984.1 nucleotide-binding protein [Vibrio sp. Sgm 22]
MKSLHSSDYGIFVFSPDDEIKMRGNVTDTVRDNVLFELGLFIGRLGKSRCFIVTPDNIDLHIPTDLLGVTPATYSGARDESELEATLGPVSHEIRKAMKVQGLFKSQSKSEQKIPTSSNDNYDEDDKLILLESWLENEAVPGVAIKYSDVDDLLKIDNGSTKKLLSYLFKPNGLYRLSSSGANVFKFYVENIYSL